MGKGIVDGSLGEGGKNEEDAHPFPVFFGNGDELFFPDEDGKENNGDDECSSPTLEEYSK